MQPRFPQTRRRSASIAPLTRVALLGALGIVACSALSDEPRGRSAKGIAGGDPDVAHESVFLLVSHTENAGGLCTATLIAPNLLLTARHCVSPGTGDDHVLCGDSVLGEPYPASAFFSTNDARPRDGSPVFKAAEVRVPVKDADTCGYDVALVILNENVPSSISVPAVPRIDREVRSGEQYTAVGYGVDQTGDSTGSRMQLAGLSIACEPGSCGSGVEASEFRGETGICSGDSGGPALDADGKVVGVVSRGGPDCGTPVYGTVTAWHDFIVETAIAAAKLGNYEAPFWVTTGSSDPPLVIDGQGGASGSSSSGGAAGETAPEPALALAQEGDDCGSTAPCEEGLACYQPDTEPLARCTRTCATTAECSSGNVCEVVGGRSVCVPPRASADEKSGCSIARASGARFEAGWWLAVAAAAMLSRRRR